MILRSLVYVVSYLYESVAASSPVAIVTTIASTLLVQRLFETLQHANTADLKNQIVDSTLRVLKELPFIEYQVNTTLHKELRKAIAPMAAKLNKQREVFGEPIRVLPAKGMSQEAFLARLDRVNDNCDKRILSGALYAKHDPQFLEFLAKVYIKTAYTNPMHDIWPLVRQMEAEVVSICRNLVHEEPGGFGMLTYGGTFSIFEACKAYVVDAKRRGIKHPEIVMPDTAHAAFDKSAEILGVRLIKVPVNPRTGAADVSAMTAAMNSNTCMVVASAPSFPHGVLDPVAELAANASARNIPLHVDACLGGFLSVFMEKAGFPIPSWDFRVRGVTSISMDTHKFGEAGKGSSVLLFSRSCIANPIMVYLRLRMGLYVTKGLAGSESGVNAATTLATLCTLGEERFVHDTRAILTLTRDVVDRLRHIDGIEIPYEPLHSVISARTQRGVNLLIVAEQLSKEGIEVQTMQNNSSPDGIHFCLTQLHTTIPRFADNFESAWRRAVQFSRDNPKDIPRDMKLYGFIPREAQREMGELYALINQLLPDDPIPGLTVPSAAEKAEEKTWQRRLYRFVENLMPRPSENSPSKEKSSDMRRYIM